ncbi:MAG: 23S rRNA (pseudouridine(1915)-N(3))-methyltransferase RlmH [Lachnospiraceae bacterium]|nr:23S rRNA (pseudouridine(1915)-N(3))-methyltransferase RlmH [Lachnospiraceae bacterium]
MKITIVCVGKIKEKFYREAIMEYSKRMSKYASLEILEVSDEKTKENLSEIEKNKILEAEGSRILSKIPDSAFVTTLDIEGKKKDSLGFSNFIESNMNCGNSHLVFVIGGSLGLSSEVKKRGNASLSFSDMTFPHQLMRVILLEQIYRAFRIMRNEPYHK